MYFYFGTVYSDIVDMYQYAIFENTKLSS